MQLGIAGPNAAVQDVNLQVPEPEYRGKHGGISIGPAHERQDTRHELFWREGYGEDIVDSPLEGRQLGFEVAVSRKRDDGEPPARSCRLGEPFQDPAPGNV